MEATLKGQKGSLAQTFGAVENAVVQFQAHHNYTCLKLDGALGEELFASTTAEAYRKIADHADKSRKELLDTKKSKLVDNVQTALKELRSVQARAERSMKEFEATKAKESAARSKEKGTIKPSGPQEPAFYKALKIHMNESPKALEMNVKYQLHGDFLEREKPFPVAMSEDAGREISKRSNDLPYMPEHQKWVSKQMSDDHLVFTNAAIVRSHALRQMQGFLTAKMPRNLRPIQLGAGSVKELQAVFDPSLVMMKPGKHYTQCDNDFALHEVQVGLKGEVCIFGIHIDALPGATLNAKHRYFCELDVNGFKKLAHYNGFHYKLTEGSIYVLPAGFMLMYVNRAEVEGDAEKDNAKVAEYLRVSIYGSDLHLASSLAGARRIVRDEGGPPSATYSMVIDHLSMKMTQMNEVEDATPPKKSKKS